MCTIHVTGDGPEVHNRLLIGDGCFIGTNAMFNLSDNVVIGRNVSVGPYVRIYTSTHEIGPTAPTVTDERSRCPLHHPLPTGDRISFVRIA